MASDLDANGASDPTPNNSIGGERLYEGLLDIGTQLIACIGPARSRSSAVSRATSSAILASICVIVEIGVRQRYPTSA